MSTDSPKQVKIKTLVLFHGFGFRGYYWDPIRHSGLENKFHQIFAPDLNLLNIETAVSTTKNLIKEYYNKYGSMGPIFLVGHSLGGVLAALIAKELGTEIVQKMVIIATPYGETGYSDRSIKFQRWLLKHDWLLPGFITRPRFFTKRTPKKIQKALWKKTVKESHELIDTIISPKYYQTDKFSEPLSQKVLVIASKDDQVVKFEQAEAFAKVLGAEMKIYEKVGHNDLIYAPNVASKVIEDIIEFLLN